LGLPTPAYLHLPAAVNGQGEKLSKQTRAPAVDLSDPAATLDRVLRLLGHAPPAELASAGIAGLWQWAVKNWQRERLPRARTIAVTKS